MTECDRPPFWAEKADRMVGKTVLVGITYVTHEGRPDGQRQFHGVIEQADQRRGFAVRVNPDMGQRVSLLHGKQQSHKLGFHCRFLGPSTGSF